MRLHRLTRLPLSAACLCVLLFAAGPLEAQDKKNDGQTDDKLPVAKVVLFNSGVGFYEHRGQIEGNDTIELKFNVEDINDLLKSMVLQDMGGGHVSTVSYGSRDPITKTLRSFAIDLTGNPNLAQLLAQIRGKKVRVQTPNPIEGVVIGVEQRSTPVDDKIVEEAYLNLLTEDGLRSIAMKGITGIQILDPQLAAELREALNVLATGLDTDKKTVKLNFTGKGVRPVRVGYIQESPVWKTSYRLVLGGEDPPLLQGWAIVENTTDRDWKDVTLTLVSGRPISFVMDLYSPLYAPRPVVQHELYASLRPQSYGQSLAEDDRRMRRAADGALKDAAREEKGALAANAPGAPAGRRALLRQNATGGGFAGEAAKKADEMMDLTEGVQALAQAQDVGEVFQYTIAMPISLQRQRSAMIPIVNDSVKAEKVSIYNPSVQAKHPLNGLRLTNSTSLHLMQGPVTVFDEGVYAGDATIPHLAPAAERLISYALDLDVEVAPTAKDQPEQLIRVSLVKGTLYWSRKYARTTSYVVKNTGKKARQVLIERPLDPSWTLVAPKEPAEKTRDQYRFLLTAEPGKPETLAVEEERTVSQGTAVTNLDNNAIVFYLNAKVVSDEVKAALKEVIRRKAQISDLVAQRQQLEQQIKVIDQEQSRIRQNMAQLPKDSELFNRYVKKFTDQETQIEDLREKISKLIAEEAKQRKALDEYLLGLDLK